MNKRKHDTFVSNKIIADLEEELNNNEIQSYKAFCKYISRSTLDGFLGWFAQECIERYIRIKSSIDEEELDKLSEEECNKMLTKKKCHPDDIYEFYKAGYHKAVEV